MKIYINMHNFAFLQVTILTHDIVNHVTKYKLKVI